MIICLSHRAHVILGAHVVGEIRIKHESDRGLCDSQRFLVRTQVLATRDEAHTQLSIGVLGEIIKENIRGHNSGE